METTEILKKLSEPLKIEDVDFRIQSINNGGYATILAYKDARVDMNRLDEVCGALWQKKFEYIESKGILFCKVGVKINEEWIWREDLGTESFSDKQKGQASDAFKRACFNWGIGRELYDYPFISIKLNESELQKGTDGKFKASYNLKLKEWKWDIKFNDTGKIEFLQAKDQNGITRFTYKIGQTTSSAPTQTAQPVTPQPKAKKVLKVMNGTEFTAEWYNLLDAVNTGKVKSIEQVSEHYDFDKSVEQKLNELFNYQPA